MSEVLRIKNDSGHPFTYATTGSIGMDLRSCMSTEIVIQPGGWVRFDTGISIELPEDCGALVQPRSGLTSNHGIVCATGVIDRDYRGVIAVTLFNLSREPYTVWPGDRIAQLVIVRVPEVVAVREVLEMSETARGANGFGSTGRGADDDFDDAKTGIHQRFDRSEGEGAA